jgi:hypothetical protein
MPQALVPIIQAIGSAVVTGGIALATAQAIAAGSPIIGSATLKSLK